jgi:pilus assembly protein Flp/PilA
MNSGPPLAGVSLRGLNVKSWTEFLRNEDAATAVEYAVMLAMILLTAIVAVASFGTQTGGMWGSIGGKLDDAGF